MSALQEAPTPRADCPIWQKTVAEFREMMQERKTTEERLRESLLLRYQSNLSRAQLSQSAGITILKNGTLPAETMLIGKCDSCGCEFEAPRSLWKARDTRQPMQDDFDAWWEIKCPQPGCGTTVRNDSK